ncbi:MAG: glutamate synthase central domain-containing protein [Pyrinomonadaceae bacterium]
MKNYIKAVNKGVVKVISKMGISTIQSYCGAQIFEALGLGQAFVDRYFTWTPSRIGGVGLDVIAEEVKLRIRLSSRFLIAQVNGHALAAGGEYQWRQ